MPDTLPNLAGVATQDLVETIGSGSYKASYINWSRTLNLLHQHAPGWCAETVTTVDGNLVHAAPGTGGYLLIRFRHVDGTVTPAVPQAVMDNRNGAIPFDKISARDVTDTQRRGTCMAAAFIFGLAHELWAKMPLESGYGEEESAPVAKTAPAPAPQAVKSAPAPALQQTATREAFLETAIEIGLSTHAAEALLQKIGDKYESGIKTLRTKDAAWIEDFNKSFEPKKAPAKTKKAAPEATEGKDW